MVVYLDIIILTDFIMTFLSIAFISKLLKYKINYKMLFVSSLLSSLSFLCYLFSYIIYFICKLFFGVLITYIYSIDKPLKHRLIITAIYYLLYFTLIGILTSFNITNYLITIISFFITLLLIVIESRKKFIINQNINTYNLMIELNNLQFSITGYMDSGNDCVFKNLPIIFIDKKFFNNDFVAVGNTIISTANGVLLHTVYKANKIILNKCEISAYLCFADLDTKECLLNILLL